MGGWNHEMKIKHETVGDSISSRQVNHQALGFKPTNMGDRDKIASGLTNKHVDDGGDNNIKISHFAEFLQQKALIVHYKSRAIPHICPYLHAFPHNFPGKEASTP